MTRRRKLSTENATLAIPFHFQAPRRWGIAYVLEVDDIDLTLLLFDTTLVDLAEPVDLHDSSPIFLMKTTDNWVRTGEWTIVHSAPFAYPFKRLDWSVTPGGIVHAFRAYHGLVAWDELYEKSFYDYKLLSGARPPSKRRYLQPGELPSWERVPAPPESTSEVRVGRARKRSPRAEIEVHLTHGDPVQLAAWYRRVDRWLQRHADVLSSERRLDGLEAIWLVEASRQLLDRASRGGSVLTRCPHLKFEEL